MGLFKSMKDLSSLTKEAKQLQRQQQQEAGYKPGFGGQMQQMGDMLSQANEQLADLTDNSGERGRLLANGIPGQGDIVGHGTPERGAQWFNLDIDLEVHVSGRQPYRVNNQYMVPAGATLGPGVSLPIKVDPNDPAKIAIDWESAQEARRRARSGRCGVRWLRARSSAPPSGPAATTWPSWSGSRSSATPAPSPTPSSSSRRRRSSAHEDGCAARALAYSLRP